MKINWNKLYAITGTSAVLCGGLIWAFTKASAFAPLPAMVANHEGRISALESENATNQVKLGDRLDNIDRDLQFIFRRLGGTNQNYMAR